MTNNSNEHTVSKRRGWSRRRMTALALGAAAMFSFGACSSSSEEVAGPNGSGAEEGGELFSDPGVKDVEAKCVVSEQFKSCFESCQNAAVGPANLFIMFDSSLSMADDAKWDNATDALRAFFSDPESEGLGVALRFFPDNECDEYACNVGACGQPAVPLGALSASTDDPHRAALTTALDAKGPSGGTPMHPALEGAINWAKTQLESEEVQRPIVVLVTDGAPFGCQADAEDVPKDIEVLAQQAADAYNDFGILTYVVGLEGSWEWIVNKVAAAGGTGKAILVSGDRTYEELLGALQSIKEAHVECEVSLPPESDFSELDPGAVNVNYTATGATIPVTLDQVAGSDACAAAGGWYYDNPEAPTKISLCPDTCTQIQSDKLARLDVLVGCDTQLPR
jgi:hypothetical protein